MRYFINLSYDGANYHGWQIQPHSITVQETLEKALATVMRQHIEVTGAGRTDSGVHARVMVAHFDSDSAVDCKQLAYRLNRVLPHDIAVNSVYEVAPDMHARFSATARTYHYYIHTKANPFLRDRSCLLHYQLDFAAMQQAADMLKQYEDFACFCKSHTDVKTTLCEITQARWVQTAETEWYFEITANRFLRNMVRAVVGTLVEVGRGRMSIADFQKVIASGKRTNAGESMPGHALFLENVEYPLT